MPCARRIQGDFPGADGNITEKVTGDAKAADGDTKEQVPGDAKAADGATAKKDETKDLVIWQVRYDKFGTTYWWDYPAMVCDALEESYQEILRTGQRGVNSDVQWQWTFPEWRAHRSPKTSKYVLDVVRSTQTNKWDNRTREIRRVLATPTLRDIP